MRILSWNINGIRTLPQYHPWNMLKTGDAILDELNADIICFQEMKIQRTALQKHLAIPNRYDSFFSFPVTRGGYSGVAVYTNTDAAAPLKAEEGLTGHIQPRPPLAPEERVSPTYPQAHEVELFPDENDKTPESLAALDAEGRALVLDFGLFVLVNLYCPAETVDTRLPYKMNFHRMLEERVRRLVHEEGRDVVVLGDINVTAAPIDHCDGHLPSKQEDFWGHPPRAWLKNWLHPAGPMVDVIRDAWPDRKGMYTCWNTKISARDSNYGTRVDYILLTRGLLPWFKHGDIQPSIRGSDHCPIYIDLHDEIRLESGQTLTLRDAMRFEEAKRNPPRISARFWDEFKQRLLSNFFTAKVPGDGPPISSQPCSTQSSTSTLGDVPSQPEGSLPTGTPDNDSTDILATTEASSATSVKRVSPSTKKNPQDNENPEGEPKKKKRKVGQTKISSFFGKPPASTTVSPGQSPGVLRTSSASTVIDVDEGEADADAKQDVLEELEQEEMDRKLALSLSRPNPCEVGAQVASSSIAKQQSKAAWGHLLAPLRPPNCRVHGEPCKEFTVNKPGPNKGKTFFICSRPVGPGYDRGRQERLREEVDMQYRCDFFKWARDVKKEALRNNGNGSGHGQGRGQGQMQGQTQGLLQNGGQVAAVLPDAEAEEIVIVVPPPIPP